MLPTLTGLLQNRQGKRLALKKLDPSEMGSGRIPSILLSYSAATLSAVLFNSLYTLADALFVSWGVSASAMGGVSVAFPFSIIQGGIAQAAGGGAASIISRKLGAKDINAASVTALTAFVSFWTSAVIIGALGILFMDPVLRLLGTPADLYPYTRQYLTVLMLGNVFSTGFSSIIRAEGNMRYALLIWVIPVTVNIILDPVFIFGLGWGVTGSAAATVLCQFVSFSMALIFFFSGRFSILKFGGVKIDPKIIPDIFLTGLPVLVQSAGSALGAIVTNQFLKRYGGGEAVTVYAFINRIISFAVMPLMAITQALSPIAGYNYGAKNYIRTGEAIRWSNIYALIYALAMLLFIEAIPEYLLRLLSSDPAVTGSAGILRICALALPFTSTAMIAGAAFQAAGKKAASIALFSAQTFFLVPALFAGGRAFGLSGVWLSGPVSVVLSCAVGLLVIKKGILPPGAVDKNSQKKYKI
jgi:putative MATE family efflux protein